MKISGFVGTADEIDSVERQKLPAVLAHKLDCVEHEFDLFLLEKERQVEASEAGLEQLGLGRVAVDRQIVLVDLIVANENLLVRVEQLVWHV